MLDLTLRPGWYDDAGERCRLVTYRELSRDERRGDAAFQAVADRAARAFVSTGSWLTTILPAMLIPVGGNLVRSLLLPGWPVWVVYFGMLVPTLPLVWVLTRGRLQRCAGQVADILLADGLCPCCLYNLSRQPTDDQLARCPECGSVWRAARIARRHDFSAASRATTVQRWWQRAGSSSASGPTRIRDDHGRERPIVHSLLGVPIANATGVYRQNLLDARREIRQHGKAKRVALALLPTLLLAPLLAIGFFLGGPPSPFRVLVLVGFASLLLLATLGGLALGSVGIRSHHIRASMLRRGLCPACAGPVGRDGDLLSDGCTQCQGCGAIWNLDRPDTGVG